MAVCPNGHDSVTDDFCDACGTRIASSPVRVVGRHHAGGPRPAGSPDGTCPWCGSASSGQFCPHCGFRVRRPFAPLGAPVSSPAPPPDLPPEPVAEPERPAFLDWFQPREPPTEPKPAARPEPPTEPEPLTEPEPPAFVEPDPPALIDESAAQEAAESYSWSAYAVSPALPSADLAPPEPPASSPDLVPDAVPLPPSPAAPPTAPMPKYTPATWSVVVTSDRMYYEQMQQKRAITGSNVAFPAISTERRFELGGKQMRIGRRSAARGVEPEIDLSAPPVDPGISRLHALLLPAADGSWAVLDPGSANGTLLNGREIASGDLIPLRDGDRINLGAWTAITLRRE